MSAQRFTRARVGIGIIAGLLLTSCTDEQDGGDNKAGGDDDPVVLTMADATVGLYYNDAVQHFVDQVERLSDGALRIDVQSEWGHFAPDAEQQVVSDVAAGEADLAWVWTHAFDSLDIDAFRALNAPMLIESYPLQQAVIASDIPGEMLAALDEVGVAGIAVLAEGMHKPVAVDHPLLTPADYRGITFTSRRSTTHARSIVALGANTEVAIASARTAGLSSGEIDGYEMHLLGYSIGELEYRSPYVTANVNLWANPAALIANPDTLAGLTETQREWVMQAGAEAAQRSSELVNHDAELLVELCDSGARFATASPEDLAAMRKAFETVYTTLERDQQTADFIARIEQLKAVTDPGPALDVTADCTGVSPLAAPAPADTDGASGEAEAALNGVYRWTLTEEDVRDASVTIPEDADLEPTVFTVTLDDGTATWTEDNGYSENGTYTVDGDTVTFDADGARTDFTFTSDYDGTLHLQPVGTMNPADALVWTGKPWQRIDRVGAEKPATVSVDGTYRWTLTSDDAREHGTPNDQTPEALATFPQVFTVALHDGTWTLDVDDGYSVDGTYAVEGETITFDWPDEGARLRFALTVDDDGALHLQMLPPITNPGDVFVWTTMPWERID